ncbi:hypothetical protein CONPUDRAFT_169241 [Coniophora puteana RWD-64-598 SS2]|uniref:Fungal-type protein kinase domain-containing protein n=1 Tax=Coniophora puteana (strain RWD-64-598) TaxID=741705 RepID=A0A5M3MA99_CONPW|nr:uncharacterized protein CONPUDRAFT_169241 [Coniophora puteana RWD-64-598 SS2]EIW76053.1 hypothetical protein CONPUDRAFT_169241 [Coniophora puteana RWD-64-598 SS2]
MADAPRPTSAPAPVPAPSSRTPAKKLHRQSFYGDPYHGPNSAPPNGLKRAPKPNSNRLQQVTQKAVDKNGLEKMMRSELRGATWEMKPIHLARALSRKSRKDSAPLLSKNLPDSINHYDVHLHVDDDKLEKAVETLQTLQTGVHFPLPSASETLHYLSFAKWLRCCLEVALKLTDEIDNRFYSMLSFIPYNKELSDGIGDVSKISPDLAGYIREKAEEVPPEKFSWIPSDEAQDGKKLRELLIPVEVKSKSWPRIVLQAATYSRGLFYAVPLRQYSLVLGYHHVHKELRFLVYHSGGLTASTALKIDDRNDRKEILRLFCAILTWQTRGDAGLPEWCDHSACCLPREAGGHVAKLRIKEVLQRTLAVRGRCPEIWRLWFDAGDGDSESDASAATIPVTMTQGISASKKRHLDEAVASENKRTKLDGGLPCTDDGSRTNDAPFTQPSDTSNTNASGGGTGDNHGNMIAHLTATPLRQSEIRSIRQRVDYLSKDKDIFANKKLDLVSKCSWVSSRYFDAEKDLFGACGDEFGVAKHYYSSIVHHQEDLPATNHLFLEFATRWELFNLTSDEKKTSKERRVLLQHVSNFAGVSLVTAESPEELFTAIAHAMLGYWNMLRKGFQHRDISIGNVLLSKAAQRKESVLQKVLDLLSPQRRGEIGERAETLKKIKELLEALEIDDKCKGFVIDGDLSINLSGYNFKEDGTASRSGTAEFMSTGLIRAAEKGNSYLHSPIDDSWSFFFVAVWAAVWHRFEGPIPPDLASLRTNIAGGPNDRDAVVSDPITALYKMKVEAYGSFLPSCQQFLIEWRTRLRHLDANWREYLDANGHDHDALKKQFLVHYERGLVDYLELLQKYFPPRKVQP